ncbi:MAG TPA: hypothetical protein DCP69_02600 [Candidatus Omnitrophica bacterium]|nr:hypothetical protein [Candidatus Omnitrophota bacterium]
MLGTAKAGRRRGPRPPALGHRSPNSSKTYPRKAAGRRLVRLLSQPLEPPGLSFSPSFLPPNIFSHIINQLYRTCQWGFEGLLTGRWYRVYSGDMSGEDLMTQGSVRLRVPELLKERGWSISELMRRSGLSYPTVLRLAKQAGGEAAPVSLETALAIARAFEIPLDDLIEKAGS